MSEPTAGADAARTLVSSPAGGPVLDRIRALVAPIVEQMALDLYDLEQRGPVLRVTIDTPPGSPGGVDLDTIALATRLISRELDHSDPVPGRYTLEVTSPGVERSLRTPAHFQREVGKRLAVRLADVTAEHRRLEGVLVAADDVAMTLRLDGAEPGAEQRIEYHRIDRARTIFEWGPAPKPTGPPRRSASRSSTGRSRTESAEPSPNDDPKEQEES